MIPRKGLRRRLAIAVIGTLALSACAPGGGPSGGDDTIDAAPSTAAEASGGLASTVPTDATVSTVVATSMATTTTTPPVETAPATTTTLAPLQSLTVTEVGNGYSQPVLAVAPPGDPRLFVVERRGVIHILGHDEPFLDIDDRVNSEDGIEPGLLGLAFHPDFARTGRFYVYYYRSDTPQTQLSSFLVSDDPDAADHDSETPLMTFDQPTNRHNGGMLQFDDDGYLFLSLGEGGDASTHAQDPATPLGSILRFELTPDGAVRPASNNPFADGSGAPEVWAFGFRNPWRFDIDGSDLYVGDVGHERWEEIDVIRIDGRGGENLGWLEMEGTHCFRSGCDPVRYTPPVLEYSHDEGCSVTGGVVYRGRMIPELDGHYLYADWCGGWVRSFRLHDGEVRDEATRFEDVGQINGFGTDADGEVYLLTYDGRVVRIDAVR